MAAVESETFPNDEFRKMFNQNQIKVEKDGKIIFTDPYLAVLPDGKKESSQSLPQAWIKEQPPTDEQIEEFINAGRPLISKIISIFRRPTR